MRKFKFKGDVRLLRAAGVQVIGVLERKLTWGIVFSAERQGLLDEVLQLMNNASGSGILFGRFCAGVCAGGKEGDSVMQSLYEDAFKFLKLKDPGYVLGLDVCSALSFKEWGAYHASRVELRGMGYGVTLAESPVDGTEEEALDMAVHWCTFIAEPHIVAPDFAKLFTADGHVAGEVLYSLRGVERKRFERIIGGLAAET